MGFFGGLTRENLKVLALKNVVEITFTRRDKNRRPVVRRMIMTLDPLLLNSANGKKVLRFRKPNFPPAYNAASKNLLFVWDIIMEDWRAVPIESCKVHKVIPTRSQKNIANVTENKKAQDEFWEFFRNTIYRMSPREKSAFMDKP